MSKNQFHTTNTGRGVSKIDIEVIIRKEISTEDDILRRFQHDERNVVFFVKV